MIENTKEAMVRRVIRRKGTSDYFKGDGWTQNLEEAWNFCDSVEAAQACASRGLVGVELALLIEGRAQSHEVFSTGIR